MEEKRGRTLNLVAGNKSSGEKALEEVLVTETSDPGIYCLAATPGLVLGVAAGDSIKVDIDSGEFEVIERGGNLAVQVYGPADLVNELTSAILQLGGRLDGQSRGLTVYTVPVSRGFGELEKVLNVAVARSPELEWYYGNVYDPVDGVTPLNWWLGR
jgi:Domain of unknown function (DUF4265)